MTRAQTQPAANTQAASQSSLDTVIEITRQRQNIREQAAAMLEVPQNAVFDLLRDIWRVKTGEESLTDRELHTALCLITKFDLNPFTREIYANRDKHGKVMVIVGIDGWIKILHRCGDYDGHTQDVQFDEAGEAEWVDTTIFSKTRQHPTTYRAYATEYAKLGGFMKAMIPIHMLRLFSFRHATRFFTPIGGHVVTPEEAEWMTEDRRPTDSAGDSLKAAVAESVDHTRAINEIDQRTAGAIAQKPEPIKTALPDLPEPDTEPPSVLDAEPDPTVESASVRHGLLERLRKGRITEKKIQAILADADTFQRIGTLLPTDFDRVTTAASEAKRDE